MALRSRGIDGHRTKFLSIPHLDLNELPVCNGQGCEDLFRR